MCVVSCCAFAEVQVIGYDMYEFFYCMLVVMIFHKSKATKFCFWVLVQSILIVNFRLNFFFLLFFIFFGSVPIRGTASDVVGMDSATRFRNTVKDRSIVTPAIRDNKKENNKNNASIKIHSQKWTWKIYMYLHTSSKKCWCCRPKRKKEITIGKKIKSQINGYYVELHKALAVWCCCKHVILFRLQMYSVERHFRRHVTVGILGKFQNTQDLRLFSFY